MAAGFSHVCPFAPLFDGPSAGFTSSPSPSRGWFQGNARSALSFILWPVTFRLLLCAFVAGQCCASVRRCLSNSEYRYKIGYRATKVQVKQTQPPGNMSHSVQSVPLTGCEVSNPRPLNLKGFRGKTHRTRRSSYPRPQSTLAITWQLPGNKTLIYTHIARFRNLTGYHSDM